MHREIRILTDGASLSVLADHAVIPPFGVAAGVSGAANKFVVVRDGEEIQPSPVPGKVGGFVLRKNDIVRMQSAGGGGHGDPLKRDPLRVAKDVQLGYLSAKQAKGRYGVVFAADGLNIVEIRQIRHGVIARVYADVIVGGCQLAGQFFRCPSQKLHQ